MLAFLLSDLANFEAWWRNPAVWLLLGFQVWMLVDAILREEWIWAILILFFSVLTAILYFFLVYRPNAGALPRVELPGAGARRRAKQLQNEIARLDKPHLHLELGDLYLAEGKLDRAAECYRATLERDPTDLDAQAHLGQCLFRQKKYEEALPLLEKVCAENPRHDYGETLMAMAETLQCLGQDDQALRLWEQVLEHHSYARARVELAEIYLRRGDTARARTTLEEAVADQAHAPDFQRKREKAWVTRARRLLRGL